MSDNHWMNPRRFNSPNYHPNRPYFEDANRPLYSRQRGMRRDGRYMIRHSGISPLYNSPPPCNNSVAVFHPNGPGFSRPPPPMSYDYLQQSSSYQPPLPQSPPPPIPPPPASENGGMEREQFQHFRPGPRPGQPSPMQHRPFNICQRQRPQQKQVYPLDKKRNKRPISDDESMLPRKKPMSRSYPTKPWDRFDAEKARQAELQYSKKDNETLLVRFPEPDITTDMVTTLNSSFESVHFQVPGSARYCFVQVKGGSDVDALIDEVNKTDFYGRGLLTCERKLVKSLSLEQINNDTIDPYTLYLGNLPPNLPASTLKETFRTAHRVDIGVAQRMKCTRYAFIRYHTVEDAIEAFRFAVNFQFDSRSLVVRFRRQKAKVEPQPIALSQKEITAERQQLQWESEVHVNGPGCSSGAEKAKTDETATPEIETGVASDAKAVEAADAERDGALVAVEIKKEPPDGWNVDERKVLNEEDLDNSDLDAPSDAEEPSQQATESDGYLSDDDLDFPVLRVPDVSQMPKGILDSFNGDNNWADNKIVAIKQEPIDEDDDDEEDEEPSVPSQYLVRPVKLEQDEHERIPLSEDDLVNSGADQE